MATLQEQIDGLRFGLERRAILLTPFTELEVHIPLGGDAYQTMIEFDGDPNTITRTEALSNFPTYIDGKYSIFFASLGSRYNQFSDGGKLWICTKRATDTEPPTWELIGTGTSGEPTDIPIEIVENIIERDALDVPDVDPLKSYLVFVIDASDDPTITSGGALYIWKPGSPGEFKRLAQYEEITFTSHFEDDTADGRTNHLKPKDGKLIHADHIDGLDWDSKEW